MHIDPLLQNRKEMVGFNPYTSRMDLVIAKVVAVHTDTGCVDVALDDAGGQGGFLANVPVTSWSYATQTGEAYLPSNIKLTSPMPSSNGTYDIPVPSGEQDVWCVVGFASSRSQRAVCLGFLSPIASQVHTKDAGYAVKLHESGVWSVIDPSGNVTIGLPDGSNVVIGTSTTPTAMSEQNPDWSPKTTTTPYNVTLSIKGNVTLSVVGDVSINASGNVYVGASTGSGKAVARVGDLVNLTTGVIESGSAKVFSG